MQGASYPKSFVAYYRVSTAKQGASGLGLEAQMVAVARYLEGAAGRLLAEYTEVESGKRRDRPMLDKALHACRVHGATLIVAKLDRLSRNVAFLSNLLESGVEPRFADLPEVQGPQGRFLLQAMAAVAELEAGMISGRTKAALAEAKKRGVRLGGYRGASIDFEARALAVAAKRAKATKIASDIAPIIKDIKADMEREGLTASANAIAKVLSQRRIQTPAGKAEWQAVQVLRILSKA